MDLLIVGSEFIPSLRRVSAISPKHDVAIATNVDFFLAPICLKMSVSVNCRLAAWLKCANNSILNPFTMPR